MPKRMTGQVDSTTFELGEARLALKDGLRISIQYGAAETWYLIEDDSRGEFYRLGIAEYTFVAQLDGRTTLASALATTCSLVSGCMMGEHEAAEFCKWLVDAGLAHTNASTSSQRMDNVREKDVKQQLVQALNPISLRFPFWNPDRFLGRIEKYFRWMFSLPMAVVGICVAVMALLTLSADWQRFINPQVPVFSRHNLAGMAAIWIVLKLAHEFAHAMACKRFGGRVGRSGIVLLLLIPLPFVDVTSSWRFSNKYHRILVSAAGMLMELFIAAIATLVWCRVGPGIVSQQAANIMITASLHTILFNANPLMRFDGYYILSDWLEIPNLGLHGQQYLRGVAKRIFFDLPAPPMRWVGFRAVCIKVYGVLAAVWKVIICVSLTMAAANLFQGLGLILAFFGMTLWGILPAWNLLKYLAHGNEYEQPNCIRCGVVCSAALVALVGVGLWVPGPRVVTAPVVIDYEPLTEIRAEVAGFVRSIHVQPDQQVAAGDRLVVLENDQLETEVTSLELQLQEAVIEASRFRSQGELGLYQSAEEKVTALRTQRDQLREQRSRLEILAPVSGVVIAEALDAWTGQFVTPGKSLLKLGDPTRKSATALVKQDRAADLRSAIGRSVYLRVWGHGEGTSGPVCQVSPRALDEVPHFAFAGTAGGPLDVVNRSQVEDVNAAITADPSALKLLEPRIQLTILLHEDASGNYQAGQTGLAYIQVDSGSLGHYLYDATATWLRSRARFTHGL